MSVHIYLLVRTCWTHHALGCKTYKEQASHEGSMGYSTGCKQNNSINEKVPRSGKKKRKTTNKVEGGAKEQEGKVEPGNKHF